MKASNAVFILQVPLIGVGLLGCLFIRDRGLKYQTEEEFEDQQGYDHEPAWTSTSTWSSGYTKPRGFVQNAGKIGKTKERNGGMMGLGIRRKHSLPGIGDYGDGRG
jgi:hypothetical protein